MQYQYGIGDESYSLAYILMVPITHLSYFDISFAIVGQKKAIFPH